MELDELKSLWKQQERKADQRLLSDDELLAILHSKATNSIDSLKRSVRFELWFTIVVIFICVVVGWMTPEQSVRNFSLIGGILSAGFGFYYYKKLALLQSLTIDSRSVRENLSHLIGQFDRFLWFYRWGYNILIFIALFVGAFAGIQDSTQKDWIQLISQIRLWLVLFAVLVPIAVIFNYGMKLYLKKLYGTHLTRLHAILAELQN